MELWQHAERKRQELVDAGKQTDALRQQIASEGEAKRHAANDQYVELRRAGHTPDSAIDLMAAEQGKSRSKMRWPSIYDDDNGTEDSLAEAIRMAC